MAKSGEDRKKRSRSHRIVWVTHHAAKRFKQRVTNLSDINAIRRQLTDMLTESIEVTPSDGYLESMCRKHKKPGIRYFRARFESRQYIIVICEGEITPWAIITVRPNCQHFFNLAGGKKHGERLDY